MFGIPEEHISNLVDSGINNRPIDNLIEELGELTVALAKHQGEKYDSWDASRNHICEEMTHVAITMALVARQFNIDQYDIAHEVRMKAIKDRFDTTKYKW